jgi:hypothetical protein
VPAGPRSMRDLDRLDTAALREVAREKRKIVERDCARGNFHRIHREYLAS